MPLFLGIDTSNYTTSVALYDSDNNIDYSAKMLLPVKAGEKGIRQSDAVFHHTQQLPLVIEKIKKHINQPITAVGVSSKPRPVDGSYMPCFTVGVGLAKSLSLIMGVPLYEFTHQHGHIVSALYSVDRLDLIGKKFLSFHVSGGTTEALLVDENFNIQLVAETLDLNAGQAVDRIGLLLGCTFPCGNELEKLALNFKGKVNPKPTLKDCNCCISGVENQCKKMIDNGKGKEEVAFYCLKYIEETIYKMSLSLRNKYGELPIVFAGGVMSNIIIQESMKKRMDCIFAKPEYSTDNAVGISCLAYRGWKNANSNT